MVTDEGHRFIVKPTHVKKHPSTDPIVILHPFNMDELNINSYDYVSLRNTVHYKDKSDEDKSKTLEMSVQAISCRDKYSKMSWENEDYYPNDKDKLGKHEIAVDQTCREALVLKVKVPCEVTLFTTHRKYSIGKKLLTRLDYQKAVVRVQKNDAYYERKTPVVCLCEEIMKSIGAEYGEKLEVEHKNKIIIAKSAKLTVTMKDFHDQVLHPSPVNPGTKRNLYPPYHEHFQYPEDYGIKSEFSQAEMIHPIFMDTIARESIDVVELDPVKIRRNFKWQVLKTVNRLGSVSAPLAITVLAGFAGVDPLSRAFYVLGMTPLVLWLIWSVITSSNYRISSEND